MKNTIKLLSILILFLTLNACDTDDGQDDPPIDEETTCMEFVDMHSQVKDARHIFFLNANEGWMIGFSGSTLETNAQLLHTTDGGQSWSIINTDLGFGMFMHVNNSNFKLQFTDANHGYISIDFGMDGYSPAYQYYYTNDKGVTWDAVPLPDDADLIHETYGMGVNSTQMVFAARINPPYPSESCHKLYFVSNTTHTITSEVVLTCDFDFSISSAHDIHFTDSGIINMSVATLDPYQKLMAHSENFGASWTYTPIEYDAGHHSYMEFVNDNIGYLPANTVTYSDTQYLYKTIDGGATWALKPINTSDSGTSFFHFSFADANNGLAIRFSGTGLYKTTDGGDTWSRISCFVDEDYSFDIHTSPKNIAYPSTDNGIILTQWMDVDAEEDIDIYQNRVYFYTGE